MNLKPWDLERMTTEQVRLRLEWVKHRKQQIEKTPRDLDGGDV